MNWLARASLAVVVAAVCFELWVLWSLLWPFDPLTMKAGSWRTVQQEYKRGDWVTARLDYCQTMHGVPRLDFTLEQRGRLLPMVPRFGNERVECEKLEAPIVQLPINAIDSGPAKILIVITFRVNTLRDVVYQFETNEFTVLN